MPRITARLHGQDESRIVVKPDHEPHPWLLDFRQARELHEQLGTLLEQHDTPPRVQTQETSR